MGEKNCGTHKTQGRLSTIRQSELLTCVFFPKMTRFLKSYFHFFFSFVCFHLLKMQGALLIYGDSFITIKDKTTNNNKKIDLIRLWIEFRRIKKKF